MSYLDAYIDPDADLPDLTLEGVAEHEARRLQVLAQAAEVASSMPRRLYGADRHELALDKRRSRRVRHAAMQAQSAWLTEIQVGRLVVQRVKPSKKSEAWQEIMGIAARVDWEHYAAEQAAELTDRARIVVSWAVEVGDTKFANRALSRFQAEIERVSMAVHHDKG